MTIKEIEDFGIGMNRALRGATAQARRGYTTQDQPQETANQLSGLDLLALRRVVRAAREVVPGIRGEIMVANRGTIL